MELLSNEEQVINLLESRGGRMKQQSVVEELDWTDAKTSKVVTGLREEGKLESFRLGRENVLSLPEAEGPGDVDSGNDDSSAAGGNGGDGRQ
ncbi:helix-turn-helix transcriptional regulator [Saliphagus sp. GCM10025308]